MAQSAKPPAKSHHSGSTRKPPVINQKAEGKVKEAEPIAMEKTQDKTMPDSTEKTVSHSSSNKQNASSTTTSKAEKNESAPSTKMEARQKSSGGFFLSGVAGGVIALALGAGLQWLSVLPAMTQNKSDQTKFAAIEAQIASLKSSNETALSHFSPDQQAAIDQAVEVSQNAISKNVELNEALLAANQKIDGLQTSLQSLAAQSGDPAALNALSEKFIGLTEKINSYASLSQNTEAALSKSNENARALTDLNKRVETLSKQMTTPVQGKEMAVLMAANALKNAVDRGGSYANELETYKAIAPDALAIDMLEKTAATGLPNQTSLATEFAHVADAIAATENKAPDDAGIGQQLWASAKGLVATRPIGYVDGSNPAAIAARMEVAIQAGDNEKAISEWQNLPQSAKDISTDFIQKLEARRDVEALLSQLIAMALQQPANNGQL